MTRALALLALVAALAPRAFAQGATGIAAVDSAAAARSAWARASAALRANDLVAAKKELARAATAWPSQPTYVWASAVIAAKAGDTTGALAALNDYALLGMGRDVRAEPAFAPLLGVRGFAEVIARHDDARAPLVRSTLRAQLSDTAFWPEGVDYASNARKFYVASVRHRTIAEVSANGTTHELWKRDLRGIGAMLGVRADEKRGVIWATTSGIRQMSGYVAADSSIAALLRINASTGAIERRWDLPPVKGGHVLGDLAVGPQGDVFVSDSNEPVLYRLRPGGDTLEHFTHPLFRSLQGLAATPDGRTLYVADYSHGLLRIDLARSAVTRLDDAPHTSSLGCDGIVWDRGAIVAVQNGVSPARIMRFALDPFGIRIIRAEVLDRNVGLAGEPTIGTIVGNEFVYVANSQWDEYDDDGKRLPKTTLSAPRLLGVPLAPRR